MLIPALFALLLAVACGYALLCGDRSGRIIAAVVISGSILTIFAAKQANSLWQNSEPGILMVDVAMLCIFAAVMLKSDQYWPIWTVAAQLLSVFAHLGPLLRRADIALPFAISEQIWAWFILVQLIIVTGLRRAVKRRHQ